MVIVPQIQVVNYILQQTMKACTRFFLRSAFAVWMLTVGSNASAVEQAQPNMIVILADDLGYGDVSTYHESDVRTPNIDRLAARGMLFSNMRANCTVCSPTRAALLTGRYADRVGVPGVIRTDLDNSWGWLDPETPTLAGELREIGYQTALIGKWHLGLESPNTPNERGFDLFHGFLGDMMDSYTTHRRHGQNYMRLNAAVIEPTGHATDVFTDWACEYFQARASEDGKPFFLYLAYNAPHFPIEPPGEWLQRVQARSPDLELKRAMNVAFVEHLDASVGRLLDSLESTGLSDETIVIFTSDNGGALHYAQSNNPWRGGKQSHYDGGLRVPFMLSWPGHVEAGAVSDYNGLVFDIFPTLIRLAGGAIAADLDAQSLVDILQDDAIDTVRDLYFVRREGGFDYGGKSYQALIRGEWKLLQNNPYSPLELYNLKDDPREQNNLAQKNRVQFNELAIALRNQIKRAGAVPWQQPVSDRKID